MIFRTLWTTKNYKRNGGGKYRMHSPLTLFADACNADAPEALDFNAAVKII
jgi:hexosaminidase